MSEPTDPIRWSASDPDAPPDLTRLLVNARADLPSRQELAALGVALPASLGTGAGAVGGNTAAATAAKAGTMTAASKVAVAAIVAAVAGASWYAVSSGESAKPATTERAPFEATGAVPKGPVTPTEDLPSELPEVSGDAPSVQTPRVEAPSGRTAASPGAAELPLLQRARRMLSKDPGGALALVRRHEQEFPRGRYVQEREVIRIEALRRMGRHDEADRFGAEFNQRFPGSAHKSKLDRNGQ